MPQYNEQIEIYSMVQFFYARSGAEGVVVATNDPVSLAGQFPNGTKLYVITNSLKKLRRGQEYKRLLPGAHFISVSSLSRSFLADKLVVCDYFSKKSLPFLRVRHYSQLLNSASISVAFALQDSPADVGMQKSKSTHSLSGRARLFSSSMQKECSVLLGGKLTHVTKDTPLVPVLAIIHIFNERDIICQTVQHLLSQGVDVHIIDNWSTDGSYEIIQAMSKRAKGITYERYPERDKGKFELSKMLERVAQVASLKKGYRWVMLNDADEIRWAPWPTLTLQEAFSFVDSMGYNAIDYTVFNLVPLDEEFKEGDDPVTFFKYGKFSGIPGHFVQVKSWLNNIDAELASSGGHHVAFPDQKIFPLKFLLAHYPFRSLKHAKHKIFMERKLRYSAEERAKGWHTQYDNFENEDVPVLNDNGLIAFNRKAFYENYLLERLSGVGIKREDITN